MAPIFSSERSVVLDHSIKPQADLAQTPGADSAPHSQTNDLSALQTRANDSAIVRQLAQWDRQAAVQREVIPGSQATTPVRRSSSGSGGLPDGLRANMQAMSGIDLSDVRVNYNSDKPQQVGAHAYAQGTDIHLAPGQEKHLPHEAWHTVQQAQGRVRPTHQLKSSGVAINDDAGLEKEADVMGAKAVSMSAPQTAQAKSVRGRIMSGAGQAAIYQRTATQPTFWTPTAGLLQLMSAGKTPEQTAPVQRALDGMTLASMTPASYAAWQGTAQCKAAPHGAISIGNRTLVTQYKRSQQIMQLLGWPSFSSDTLTRVKGGLVALEGALTFGVSLAAGVLSGGVGTLPAIVGMVVGGVKFARGIIMTIKVSDANKGKKAALVDVLRALEAAGSIVGALNVDGFRRLPLLVFGIAKAFRSLLTMITDYMGEETDWPLFRKFLMMVSTAAHYVEACALTISGMDAGELAEYLGAGVAATVGASKAIRTGIQADEANRAPNSKAPATGAGAAAPATQSPEIPTPINI